jgi:hypothetical protein
MLFLYRDHRVVRSRHLRLSIAKQLSSSASQKIYFSYFSLQVSIEQLDIQIEYTQEKGKII